MGIKLMTNATVLAIVTKAGRPSEYKPVDHDAAVAHARQSALDALPEEWRIVYEVRTAEHLRDDFGIEDEP